MRSFSILHPVTRAVTAALSLYTVTACSDAADGPSAPPHGLAPAFEAVHFFEAGASVSWNAVARSLTSEYPTGQQVGARLLAYLSLAQYDAVIAAEEGKDRGKHPSAAAAVAGASAVVLAAQYPGETAALNALVTAQATAPNVARRATEELLER